MASDTLEDSAPQLDEHLVESQWKVEARAISALQAAHEIGQAGPVEVPAPVPAAAREGDQGGPIGIPVPVLLNGPLPQTPWLPKLSRQPLGFPLG
eukprot:2828877-Pyramimonas_sp.AAC.1